MTPVIIGVVVFTLLAIIAKSYFTEGFYCLNFK